MSEQESFDTKICPDCKKVNALQNLRCIKCGTNLIHVQAEPFWEDDGINHKGVGGLGDVFYEILVTFAFLFTIPLGLYGSRWFLVISLILLIYMIKNDYLSFLSRVVTRNYRR